MNHKGSVSKYKKLVINEGIVADQLRLISETGEQLGIVSKEDALLRAKNAKLDLVQITYDSSPFVCKITDYSKYLFEIKKKRGLASKNKTKVHIKEVRFRPSTMDGDYQVKMRSLENFLDKGDIVKVSVNFRGRELRHQKIGWDLLEKIKKDVENIGRIDKDAKMEGKRMLMVVMPNKKKT